MAYAQGKEAITTDALNFRDSGSIYANVLSVIPMGTTLEVFSKKPEILSPKFSDNPQTFATLYLTLYFGNKKLVKNKKNGRKGTD